MNTSTLSLAVRVRDLMHRLVSAGRDDRGDVPGWVLITLMSAGLVAAIWTVAETQLKDLFQEAIDKVSGTP